MTSNVYTKNEILQNLASKGYFIDVFTLDTFLEKWKIEAIFEDEQGTEFFDISVVDMLLNGLFNTSTQNSQTATIEEEPRILSAPKNFEVNQQPQMPNMQFVQPQIQPQMPPNMQMQPNMMQQSWQQNMPYPQNLYQQPQMPNMQFVQPQIQPQMPPNMQMQPNMQQNIQNLNAYQQPQMQQNQNANLNNFSINDPEIASVLNDISLSDGSSLMSGIEKATTGQEFNIEAPLKIEAPKVDLETQEEPEEKPKKMGILEGAMENVGRTFLKDEPIVAQMKDDTLKQLEAMGLITMEDFDKEKFENIGKKKSDNQQKEEEIEIKEIEPIKIDETSEISLKEEQNAPKKQPEVQPQKEQQNQINYSAQQDYSYQEINPININQFQGGVPPLQAQEIIPPQNENESVEFDDISLLSDSYEAQEKFREYIVSELSKKNVDLTPKNNEFKLDISERTLSMIARSMAKKIAKHVNNICAQGSTNQTQLAQIEEKNKLLEQKTTKLEEENKKLRILLTETNKNLNETNRNLESYKPTIFGLYKKVAPKKKK